MEYDPNEIRFLIYNSTEPVVLKKLCKWGMLAWNLTKWKDILGNEDLQFRSGRNTRSKIPQWERTTKITKQSFEKFLNHDNPETWLYFDYKYLKDWFLDKPEITENIQFKDFGLDTVSPSEATIWIGNKGAHTNCHIDTFGCNVVVQVYGRKRWLLFPPEENLRPSRVPYEESSIYSELNFFAPSDLTEFKGLDHCRKIDLDAGDVLIVPHKWWHFVESLDNSISINSWLPLESDKQEQINEAIVQMLIHQLTKELSENQRKSILNPNSEELVGVQSVGKYLEIINYLSRTSNINVKKIKGNTVPPANLQVESTCEKIIEKYDFIHCVEVLSIGQFQDFLRQQSCRFTSSLDGPEANRNNDIDELKFIKSITHPDVIAIVKSKLLK